MRRMHKAAVGALLVALTAGCGGRASAPSPATASTLPPARSRLGSIPTGAARISPDADPMPPILHSEEWLPPVPLPGPINTPGAEDSAFVSPDGNLLVFFFTPSPQIPPEGQLFDGVTGLYLSQRSQDGWGEPRRITLQDPEELALDGCAFLTGETLWFCSAREGNIRDIDLWIADLHGAVASGWRNAGERLNRELAVGEMHVSANGQALYYHAPRPGGTDFDLYVTRRDGDTWGPGEAIAALNTEESEGWPFLTEDGSELWFTRITGGAPAIFRSTWGETGWSPPEMILSSFAGEPTLDRAGNLYFIHHYIVHGVLVDADIFLAERRRP